MNYSAKILLDSISETGKRITTFEITFPRMILAEFNTHRMFSRNSASSRAIPFNKIVDKVLNNPFIPEQFPLNCKGMQPQEYITKDDTEYEILKGVWLDARDTAVHKAKELLSCLSTSNLSYASRFSGAQVHKQIANRLLEPFMWHTAIVTATEFDNFFKLRTHPDAQYEIRRIADLMYDAYHAYDEDKEFLDSNYQESFNKEWYAIPIQKLKVGEWHCPLIPETEDELIDWGTENRNLLRQKFDIQIFNQGTTEVKKMISVARCARVSYLTHDGKRDIEKDLELFERLRTSGHWSPFEHVATPNFSSGILNAAKNYNRDNISKANLNNGNFIGWKQFRKEFADENYINFRKE